MKMTKQGVRDLDFGWKKAVAVPAPTAGDQLGVVEVVAAVDADLGDQPAASLETAHGNAS